MKKLLSLVLALSIACIVLCSCGTQSKTDNPNKQNSGLFADKANYSYGEDLFKDGLIRIQIDDKFGYMDKKGNIVIDCTYEEATGFYNGIAFVADQDDQVFCIDTNGDTIAKIDDPNKFVNETYESVVNALLFAYKLGLVEKDGTFLYDFDYYLEELEEPCEQLTDAGYVIIQTGKDDNIQHGLYDLNKHTVIVPPVYDRLKCEAPNEYIVATKDETVQVLNFDGKVIGELPFDLRYSRFSDGYIQAPDTNIRLSGYMDHTGEWVISPKYREVSRFIDGTAAVSISEGAYYLIDKNENILSDTYENIMQSTYCRTLYYVWGDSYIGVLNKEGKEILPPQYGYEKADVEKSGHIIAVKGNTLHIYNPEGVLVTEYEIPANCVYSSAVGIYDDGYIHIRIGITNDNSKYYYYDGVIDTDGNVVLGFNYNFGEY